MQRSAGLSLIELMVSVMILSVLAAVALPYAEREYMRKKELELRESLRTMRNAIDAFHSDWLKGRIPPGSGTASEDGYPVSLEVLVEGVDSGTMEGGRRYYLRRIPRNPFADQNLETTSHWQLRSYRDEPDTLAWGGEDVYDVWPATQGTALDGSCRCDW